MTNANAGSPAPTAEPAATSDAMSGLGLAASLAALAGASCCALPLVLAIFGLGGAWVASLGVLVVYRPFIIAGAIAIVAAGWIVALRRRAQPRVHVVLGLATATVVAAVALTVYEPQVTRFLAAVWRGA